MKLQEIKDIAVNLGLKPGKAKKVELVRMIQGAENNIPCYATEVSANCDQHGCLWRDDCGTEAKKLA